MYQIWDLYLNGDVLESFWGKYPTKCQVLTKSTLIEFSIFKNLKSEGAVLLKESQHLVIHRSSFIECFSSTKGGGVFYQSPKMERVVYISKICFDSCSSSEDGPNMYINNATRVHIEEISATKTGNEKTIDSIVSINMETFNNMLTNMSYSNMNRVSTFSVRYGKRIKIKYITSCYNEFNCVVLYLSNHPDCSLSYGNIINNYQKDITAYNGLVFGYICTVYMDHFYFKNYTNNPVGASSSTFFLANCYLEKSLTANNNIITTLSTNDIIFDIGYIPIGRCHEKEPSCKIDNRAKKPMIKIILFLLLYNNNRIVQHKNSET